MQLENLINKKYIVVISSDHGMNSCSHIFHLNELLQHHGLLRFNPDKTIDFAKTKAFYHTAENGALFVNTDNYKNGIVPYARKKDIIKKIKKILINYIEPYSAKQVVKQIIDIKKRLQKSIYGDLFIIPDDKYIIKSSKSETIIKSTNKSGSHITNSRNEMIKGIFLACGEKINKSFYFKEISTLDLFPILCLLLNIPIPDYLRISKNIDKIIL